MNSERFILNNKLRLGALMVEMIPKTRTGKKNFAEDAIFEAFKAIKTRPDWIVLHSLKQSKVAQGHQAETDFVVLVPGIGIVLIEAKGAERAIYDDGRWEMEGVPSKAKDKDPFDQIERGSANILKQIRLLELDHNDIPIARLVWFPKLDVHKWTAGKKSGMAFSPWEIALAQNLNSVIATIENCLNQTIKANKEKTDYAQSVNPLTSETAKAIAKHLVGALIAGQSLEQKAKMRSLAIQQAALEHEFMIDLIDQNQNLFFEGPAGSGKSRVLRNAVKKMNKDGKQVLFLTYNLMLEEDTKRELRGLANIDVYSINDFLLKITAKSANPKGASEAWYDIELPKQALKTLKDQSKPLYKYDAIVIDEFQDFATKSLWLQVVNQILIDSKKRRPTLLLAGDDRQRVSVGPNIESSLDLAKMHFEDLFHVILKTNVRQAPNLVEEIYAFLKRPNPFRRNLLSDTNVGSLEVLKVTKGPTDEKTQENQLKKLAEVVLALLDDYDPSSIRILSPYGEQKSALVHAFGLGDTHSKMVRELKKLTKHVSNPDGKIRWRSIMKFKGLDSDVVVITDISKKSEEFAENRLRISLDDLLYMGMTRARFQVIVLVQDDLYPEKKQKKKD
jgi:superfamily I DNA/RNA helicase